MKLGTPGFRRERLTQAREARGLTAVALADMLGVSPTTISQYERTEQTPRPEIMDKLGTILGLPRAFFLKPSPLFSEGPIFYRSMSSATKSARARAENRYQWLKEVVLYLEDFFEFPETNLPSIEVPADFRKITTSQIESAASVARSYWQLGNGPAPNIVNALERNGVIVARGSLEAETLDAFSEWGKEWHPFVFLGADKAIAVRSRFDAAHELGHLLLHRNVDRKNLRSSADWKLLENQAHRFASSFLLPASTFPGELWTVSLDAFWSLKERWRVSIAAMIKRSEELELISEIQARRLWINRSRRGWREVEPLDDKIEVENPALIAQSFSMLIREGVKSKSEIVADIGFGSNDIEALSGLTAGFLSDKVADVRIMPTLKKPLENNQVEKGKILSFDRKQTKEKD